MASRVRSARFVPALLAASAALGVLALYALPCAADWEGDREREPARERPVNSIHSGAASVQFLTFGGGGQGPFHTNGIYFKTHFSDRGALRVGTDFNISEIHGEDPIAALPHARNTDSYSFTVSAEVEEYVDATGPVTVFLGVGPYWSRSRYKADEVRYEQLPSSYYISSYRTDSRSWEVGGSASAGFEWFFKRKLSVMGRVGASFGAGKSHYENTYISGDIVNPTTDSQIIDATTTSASSATAALGLGLYF